MFRSHVIVSAAVLLWTAFPPAVSHADPYADFVVSYSPGANPAAGYTNSAVVLGSPTATATVTAPAFAKTQIVSIGTGGALVVGFDTPISNNAANPFGLDFTIFNNSFFVLSGSNISSALTHPGLAVYVSQNDVNFYLLSSSTNNGANDLFPTQGTGNPLLPVNPSLTLSSFTGNTVSNALALYNGSAGGASYDLSSAVDSSGNPVSLGSISYIEVTNENSSAGEIDAFAAVTPIPEPSTLLLVAASLVALFFKHRRRLLSGILLVVLDAQAARAATSFTENFSNNPFNAWSFGIGNNSNNQFAWNSNAPPAYAGGSTGALNVALNSSLPTARLQIPLGITLTDTNSFTLSATFSFNIISAPDDQQMEMAFGLVNSSTTGGDRTGTEDSNDNFLPTDNTFSTVEFDYFPNVPPSLLTTVFGAQEPGDDAFDNSAAIYGYPTYIGEHTNGITSLPQNVTLKAVMLYDGPTKTLTLTVSQINSNGSLTVLNTGVPPMDLVANGYDTNFPFQVDTLAIMAYQDGYTTTNDISLVANLTFEQFSFCSCEVLPPNAVSAKIVGADVALAFPTLSNFSYLVQSSTDLVSGAWSNIASNIPGTGTTVTYTDTGGATTGKRFYRVGLFEP